MQVFFDDVRERSKKMQIKDEKMAFRVEKKPAYGRLDVIHSGDFPRISHHYIHNTKINLTL